MIVDKLLLPGLLSVLASVLLLGAYRVATRKRVRGPPGPPRHFLVENLYDFPKTELHLGFARLAEKYGPVMSLTLPTAKVVIVSSAKAASDLLEKRGAVFADRPEFPMLELMGWGWDFVIERYGDSWRNHRRIAHRHLNSVAVKKYANLATRLARVFALELYETPADFRNLIKRSAAASILEATYGLKIARENDKFVKIIERATETLMEVLVPGKYVVDTVPALKHIPKWFPGAQFKRNAIKWLVYSDMLLKAPFAQTKVEMERGTVQPSIVSSTLTKDGDPQNEKTVMESAAIMYLGGADTTVFTLIAFFLEMVRHPDVQARAYAELSEVVGRNRLPTLEDRAALPYIEAIIREMYRMHPVLPIAIPHCALEDTLYEGMLITKGTIVHVNLWAILNDPHTYPDPHIFNPDRFLCGNKIDNSVPDPRSAVFGYGRRKCVGMHFADMNVFLAVATTLACFDLGKVIKDGVVCEPSGEFDHGFLSIPRPFQCTITPRAANVKSLIDDALDAET